MLIGCLGMATVDTLLFTPEFDLRDEQVVPVEETVVCPGGKGLVSAAAMVLAGARVVPFSLVGRDSSVLGMLGDGLDQRGMLGVLESDSRTWITISEGHRAVTFVARSIPDEAGEIEARARVIAFAEEVDALYITLEHPPLLRSALKAAGARGLKIALNPSMPMIDLLGSEDPELFADLVRASAIVLCNEAESRAAEETLGAPICDRRVSPSLEEVVVTRGRRGGRITFPPFEEWKTFAAIPAEERCAVGAGDTFNGAYLAKRLGGADWRTSCEIGARLAAKKVASRTSALPLGNLASAP
jgi:sugar/nucleoside kinase (ribokinase family)